MTAVPGLLAHAAVRRAVRALAGGGSVATGVARLGAAGDVSRAQVSDPLAGHPALTAPLAAWGTLAVATVPAATQALVRALTGLDARMTAADPTPDATPAASRRDPHVRPAVQEQWEPGADREHGFLAPEVPSAASPVGRGDAGAGPPGPAGTAAQPSSSGRQRAAAEQAPRLRAPGPPTTGTPAADAGATVSSPGPAAPPAGTRGLVELLQRYGRAPLPTGEPTSEAAWPDADPPVTVQATPLAPPLAPSAPGIRHARSTGTPAADVALPRPVRGVAAAPDARDRAGTAVSTVVAPEGGGQHGPAAAPATLEGAGPHRHDHGGGAGDDPAREREDAERTTGRLSDRRPFLDRGPRGGAPAPARPDDRPSFLDRGGVDVGVAPEELEDALDELLRREAVRYGLEAGAP